MFDLASIKKRVLAFLIDLLFLALFYQSVFYFLVSTGNLTILLDRLLLSVFIFLIISPLFLPLISFFLIARFGGTLGKLAVGIEIVDSYGRRLSFGRAFFRNWVGYMISSAICWLGFIWIAIDKNRRGWHDLIADDFVINKRKKGWIMGIYLMIVLLICNFILLLTIWEQVAQRRNFYKGIVKDAVEALNYEINPRITPMPTVPYRDYNYSIAIPTYKPFPTLKIKLPTRFPTIKAY